MKQHEKLYIKQIDKIKVFLFDIPKKNSYIDFSYK